ncbi:endolytic transglycosylase MltG [Microgenomates group bacterium]|nr:endolytic transglycosylase MltG [Microgenomates group bacterium]
MKILKWLLLVLGAIVIGLGVLGGVGYWYWQDNTRAVCDKTNMSGCAPREIAFVVKNGEGIASVAKRLVEEGMIKNEPVFRLIYKFYPSQAQLYEGVFQVMNTMTPREIVEVLTSPPQQTTVTFLPGWRREEFAEYLDDLSLANFDKAEFLAETAGLEGQLWADTYYIFKTATAEDIVEMLTRTFEERTADLQEEARGGSRTWKEVLTIASILQRESKKGEEMKVIAGIIENRLEVGMRLQFCATAQYASGYDAKSRSWWLEPTLLDLEVASPYNTYVSAGLPPAPIAAAGRAAMEAALRPEETEYFFYLHDGEGQIHYGRNAQEHNQNKARWL